MTHMEEKGGNEAGHEKYCNICEDDAYAHIGNIYVCYDCYDTWIEIQTTRTFCEHKEASAYK